MSLELLVSDIRFEVFTFYFGVIVLFAVQWKIWTEVNRRLPPEQHWSYRQILCWHWHFWQLEKEHRRLLRKSKVRLLFWILAWTFAVYAVVVFARVRDAVVLFGG